MGTKGKKNTPITARINSGLFNQKKGITEPLLGVGPAGVYGDNQTKDIPSPSKKRGYAKRSPLKQQVGVNVLKSESTGSQIVKGKEKKEDVYDTGKSLKGLSQEQLDWRTNKIKELGGIDNYHAKYGSKTKGKKTGAQVGTGEFEDDKVIPGTTTETNEFTPTQTRDKNDAMSPWRVRQQSRSIKKSGKDVRQSQNKLDKTNRRLAGMDKADKVVGNRKYDRLMSKFNENTNELDAFKKNMTARTRQVEMSSDPLGKSGTFNSSSRDMELADTSTTYEGQKAIIEGGGVKVENTPEVKKEKKVVKGDNPDGFQKNVSGAFEGKSPMKKRGYGMKKPLYK